MSIERDPELDDLFEDPALADFANALHALKADEPPLDTAFRSGLRRQLMQKAWEMTEGRVPWWRRLASPAGLSWAGAAAGVVLIASVVVYMTTQGPSIDTHQVFVTSPVADANAVRLEQPILLAFNQPMDHPSTEAAIQVQPATRVAYTWQTNTLYVQPVSGNLAPNTQYQVTVGPGAKTAAGQTLAAPQTVRFVTQPAPSPAPTPPPTPSTLITNVKKLTALSPADSQTIWSPDGTTIFAVRSGALVSIDANTGNAKVLVATGVLTAALAPNGDRLAYFRGRALEVLTLATGATIEVSTPGDPVRMSWVSDKVQDRLILATGDAIYEEGKYTPAGGGSPALPAFIKLASLPDQPVPGQPTAPPDLVTSFAPDGTHAVYAHLGEAHIFEFATGKAPTVAPPVSSAVVRWSPDGARLMYESAAGIVTADTDGTVVATLPTGTAPSWSAQNEVLIGSETELYEVRPDGTGLLKLADGTFTYPVWAPDSTAFSFVRSGSLWTAQAPAPVAPASAIDQATTVVKTFMQARLDGNSTKATSFLDAAGKSAYQNAGGLRLLFTGDPAFSRFYILTSEVSATDSSSVRCVVRLVFAKDKVDVSQIDETLSLTRRESTDPFLVDTAGASANRDQGKGPEVVSVDITQDQLTVTFDSDLNPTTVPASVIIRDSQGKPVVGRITTYANHKVIITGLQLIAGNSYTLAVLTSLRDVSGRAVASEYDLAVVGPSTVPGATLPAPSPTPSP